MKMHTIIPRGTLKEHLTVMDNNEMKLKYDIKNFSINTKRKKREK
jgi:hypothetical protein